MKLVIAALVACLLAPLALAQSRTGSWNGLPDRFLIDAGYFHLQPSTTLRLNSAAGSGDDVNLERDLGLDDNANTFWLEGTWKLGRRHHVRLGYTRIDRAIAGKTLERSFTWGGETYNAGLSASSESTTDLLGGYYRFALVRKDRFEIGPAVGIGYLWLDARIRSTGTVAGPGGSPVNRSVDRGASNGSITGAVGGFADGWPTRRLYLSGDYLYIKVKPERSEASVTDWRIGGYYYFFRHAGLGVQYKFNKYSYDRGPGSTKLGGEIEYKGFQLFLSMLF